MTRSEYQRRYYQKNKRRMRAKNRAWQNANKDRWADYTRTRRLGMTLAEYDQWLKGRPKACAICGAKETRPRLSIDHCHATGKLRGLLCRECNIGLGNFHDDAALLRKAAKYLETK